MTNLSELAARIEAAEASEQRALLLDAVFEIAAGEWPTSKAARFYTLIDAEAYESAALMLVPEGYDWEIARMNGGLTLHAKCGSHEMSFGATPALALTCAALRAKEVSDHG